MSNLKSLRHCVVTALAAATVLGCASAQANPHSDPAGAFSTTTPIKHLVVIFQENVSFDHYFGTYPVAANPAGEPAFHARRDTPSVNGLNDFLLNHNLNSANPQRLDRSEALTCDQGHGYKQEQQAFDGGLMDKFVQFTDVESCAAPDISKPGLVMDYYDGNTITAMWNYAQAFAMSDNSFNTQFGPSTPGALNLISGQTHGSTASAPFNVANGTVIGDPNPALDDCSSPSANNIVMSGQNIGDLLNVRGISWGWFQGGFRPTGVNGSGGAVCGAKTANVGGALITDYSPHHQPFMYYASTSNPHHLVPSSTPAIGTSADQANHQYDLQDFWAAAQAGNLPAVSFLKAKEAQDGHAGYSDPLDEQQFLVDTINRLEQLPTWSSTAVIIAYDDSDGWYDHVLGPIVNQSADAANDALDGAGLCGTNSTGLFQDRCGYGPRLPLLVISPWAREDFVDHGVTDQSSILRFIEDNWQTGRIGGDSTDAKAGSLSALFDFSHRDEEPRTLFLDPATGLRVDDDHREGDDHRH